MRTHMLLIAAPVLIALAVAAAAEPETTARAALQLADARARAERAAAEAKGLAEQVRRQALVIETLRKELAAVAAERDKLTDHLTDELVRLQQANHALQVDWQRKWDKREAEQDAKHTADSLTIRRLERELEEARRGSVHGDGDGRDGESPKPAGPTRVPPQAVAVMEPDGAVAAVGADRIVFVDLGAADLLPVGVRFSVYPAGERHIAEATAAKGVIEVTQVGQAVSQCHVLAVGPEPIVQGDVIASPIFERGRKMRFCLMGPFDLDGDGAADAEGVERVRRLIERWGGVVLDRISPDVDVAVAGPEPETPSKPREQADAVTWQMYEQAAARQAARGEALLHLRRIGIPVLNQNRLLDLIGGMR